MMTEDEQMMYFLGHFVQNMAHAVKWAAGETPADVGGPAQGSEQHRRLTEMRDLLVTWPIGGHTDAGQPTRKAILIGTHAPDYRFVPISSRIMRALAHDAMSTSEFWYDPGAADGLSDHFPGKPLNPDNV